jgi:prepilin-type N-terminal cleavage/methylation domain-containing protein
MRRPLRRQAGVTLMEVLIAVTLLSLLTVGMLYALRIGLNAYTRTDAKLMENRRVAGAQRILEQELQGIIPVVPACATGRVFFQGSPNSMRLVTAFSLQDGWRGHPQVLDIFVAPGEGGNGFRLLVNETPYEGPSSISLCGGGAASAEPKSFVLADKLASCSFRYLGLGATPKDAGVWEPGWSKNAWPSGIRVDMAPLDPNPARLQPITVVVPIYLYRKPEMHYAD